MTIICSISKDCLNKIKKQIPTNLISDTFKNKLTIATILNNSHPKKQSMRKKIKKILPIIICFIILTLVCIVIRFFLKEKQKRLESKKRLKSLSGNILVLWKNFQLYFHHLLETNPQNNLDQYLNKNLNENLEEKLDEHLLNCNLEDLEEKFKNQNKKSQILNDHIKFLKTSYDKIPEILNHIYFLINFKINPVELYSELKLFEDLLNNFKKNKKINKQFLHIFQQSSEKIIKMIQKKLKNKKELKKELKNIPQKTSKNMK